MISKGGDTDTNACIAGGMLGAMVGALNIPEKQINTLLNCNFDDGLHIRPNLFHPKSIIGLV